MTAARHIHRGSDRAPDGCEFLGLGLYGDSAVRLFLYLSNAFMSMTNGPIEIRKLEKVLDCWYGDHQYQNDPKWRNPICQLSWKARPHIYVAMVAR